MPETSLPFATRLWFAWVCFFRVLFDGEFAERAFRARAPELPPPAEKPALPAAEPIPAAKPKARVEAKPEPDMVPALQLLALFQREGRLVDFLEQDIASFPDEEIGAAARLVHDGCRKALRDHAKLEPVRSEPEGFAVTLEAGFDAAAVKLTGNVQGKGPYKGTLRHRGWRASSITLPAAVSGHDARVLAPAEVEL